MAGGRARSVEWPTVVVGLTCVAGWFAVVSMHRHLPTAVTLLLLAIDGAWFMSFQHELTHGHPTSSKATNTMLGSMPFALWLPFVEYRRTHSAHHRNELTVPGVDPETFYVSQQQWDSAGPAMRAFISASRYLPIRLLVGPAWAISQFLRTQTRSLRRGDQRLAAVWMLHVAGAAVVVWFVRGVAHLPMWQYVVGYVYCGMSLSMVRSFAEHRAVDGETRSAVVLAGWFFSLLFLNNNLHHTHHVHPGVAWYRLPRLAASTGAAEIAARGAGLYLGYWDVARQFSTHPFDQEVHPLERVAA